MPEVPQRIYRNRADSYKLEAERIRKRTGLYSIFRLFLFALAIFLAFALYANTPLIALFSSLASLILLVFFVTLSSRLGDKRKMLEELIKINEEEMEVLEWKFSTFHSGSEYVDPEHPNTSDLDIFGKNSLYQYLCRCSLSIGRNQLASWLNEGSSEDHILRRQTAVGELSLKLDWRQDFQATGRMAEEEKNDYIKFQNWLNEKPYYIVRKTYRIILIILPILTILSLIASFKLIPTNIPIFLVLIQLGIVGANLRRINHHHNQISRKFKLLDIYSRLINLAETEYFNSNYLLRLQEDLSSSDFKAGEKIKSLARLVVQFDRRLNMIMGSILNALLMWDLHCVMRLEKWKISNADNVPRWFEILGEFEALNSLSNFRYNNPDSVFPKISNEDVIIEAESLAHPLIPKSENIPNNLKIGGFGEFMLITGSNMAGKSTFLRTVGINMILAGMGAPVIAGFMRWKPVKIYTSMRVRDSLSSRESTFYSELKRLRQIIDIQKSGEKVMVILDEILKGTNSRDKHFGSEMFIRQLIRDGSTGMIATHDLELSRLEEEFPQNLLNYSFEVQIDDEEFIYDYKIKRGVCQTLNATELMRKMGISLDKSE